ncbi:glutamic-type intramembrane protease PrsW [Fictibacillus enclensis]|uniref:glutamic-type intramembrane protease PrsW n=1 Tax=Fictibacillus enclensis TaxID=1017270 RepID=UPI0024C05EC5|nr:glutamic-type intramembrane protease PrsW [Fictibacillus enclensis]WHY70276.1 glutamic-type intramembrane protease PrsW [Fictibacillus enclensis]
MFGIISAGLAPAIALLAFFYLKDKYETEPVSMVIRLYIFGALLVFPVMVIQFGFKEELMVSPLTDGILLSALLEEFLKWFLVFYCAYMHAEFNEPYDGIVYAVSLSLGFASMENIFYLYVHGVNEALGRALMPVSSHALFGVISGYYFGKAKFSSGSKKKWLLVFSLIIPFALHGVYNWILLAFEQDFLIAMLPFMLFLWWLGLKKVKLANAHKTAWLARQKNIGS